ncbi:FUSC family protein [Streptomyces stelliscabiei]|uniref:Putative membrane protein YccC n=1 Tax=Streptomyces stelliscabiei TaxID=146820 RepID=A0A8I0P2L6_9ACTN|nr:FUSC family protein [Streptomyces stelliscabiei]KND41435.1 membrane protein [Streptomyces stelliscabiei]MBE1596292.1 putative membrane protein YccC [Streptomyces stelliscabiei]MDX2518104.1 FUSC family protein [Streptomyces stelliscabiei]
MSRPAALPLPPWLAHALRAQRGPVPWNAVVRGALAGGPLLLVAVGLGRPSVGVLAALGAMLAGINDRPGSRRVAVQRLGVPALAGAVGLLVGTYAGQYTGAVVLTLLLTALGLLAGGMSAVGLVASGAGTQLLVAAAIGAGMPLPEPGWERALAYLAGAGWLLVLRLALPTPAVLTAGDYRFDGERDAVAAVYDAIAGLLDAVGTPDALARRSALTAALDHAQDALAGPRLRRYASSSAERRLHAQYAAALPLAEAATALAWDGDAVVGRASEGPRRLAAAVRGNTATGPLPAPVLPGARHRTAADTASAPALRALDDALLRAAETFDRGGDARALHTRRRTLGSLLRLGLGSGGREYGLRVALSFGAAAAVAQALHHEHWYWLPATAVFLVKPDLGPLVSRVLCRAAGTVLGAVLFAAFAAVLPRPEGLIALVAVSGALIPVATRHFAAQTAVVTVLVLALVMVGGDPQASWSRIGETLLACAIVLIVGHLPMPRGQRGGGVRARLTEAGTAAYAYLAHVLDEPRTPDARSGAGGSDATGGTGETGGTSSPGGSATPNGVTVSVGSALPGTADARAARWALRREAYRALAKARSAIALSEAELPALARHTEGTDEVAALLERLVDTTTACAVHLDDTGRLSRHHTDRLTALLDELARHQRHTGTTLPEPPDVTDAPDETEAADEVDAPPGRQGLSA